jgi:hypothetical protein
MMKKFWPIFMVIICACMVIKIQAKSFAASASISHSYKTSTSIGNGSLVSLSLSKQGNMATPANTSNASRLLGVTVASNNSLIAINSSNSTIQVATSGAVNTLVSTANGNIAVGQQIAVSPFNGIGVKAGYGNEIIGLAESTLTDSSSGVSSFQVKNKQGKKQSISVGFVKLEISIGKDYSSNNAASSSNALQQLVQHLTGKTVATARIICSFIIVILALASLVALLQSSIYASIIAIGRNPLAQYTIKRTLVAVISLMGLIVGLASGSIYLLLK